MSALAKSVGLVLGGALLGSALVFFSGLGPRRRGSSPFGTEGQAPAGGPGQKSIYGAAPLDSILNTQSVGSRPVIGGGHLCENTFVARSFTGAELARSEHDVHKWLITVDKRLEIWNNAHKDKSLKEMKLDSKNDHSHTWAKAVFPPEGPLCSKELSSFGPGGWTNKRYSLGERAHRRDLEKKICWADTSILSGDNCDLISIGSAGMWDTEVVMHEKTKCRIHTFDCTTFDNMPRNIKDRTRFYKVCLGDKDFKDPNFADVKGQKGQQFLTWGSMLKLANISRVPDYLKMDIEGFEYGVMRGLAEAQDWELPAQIAMEIHLIMGDRTKTAGEVVSFLLMLYASGYRMIAVDWGTICGHCLEVLLAKVYCKGGAQSKR